MTTNCGRINFTSGILISFLQLLGIFSLNLTISYPIYSAIIADINGSFFEVLKENFFINLFK